MVKVAMLNKIHHPYSFRTKMLLLLFVCLILPLTMGGTYTLLKSLEALKVQTVISERNSLELTHSYVSIQIDGLIQTMNSVQFDEHIPKTLNAGYRNGFEPSHYITLNERLEYITRYNDIHLALYSENQWFLSQAGFTNHFPQQTVDQWTAELDTISPFQTKWFTISHTHQEAGESTPYLFVIGRKLINHSGSTTAYLFGAIETSTIEQILSNEDGPQLFTIIDDTNTIIYHNEPSKIGTSFSLEFNEDGTDGDYITLAKELPQSNLRLVRHTPYHEARDEIWQAFTRALFVQMPAYSILLLVFIYLINRFTKPIQQLTHTAKRVEKGELSVRANLKEDGELGYLGKSLDSMLEQIEEMISRIKQEQDMKRKAEMDALQAEIKPHFLFNILNTIRLRMIQNGDRSSSQLLLSLSKYMRDLYRTQELITLKEEIAHTEYYLDLMNAMRQHPIYLEKAMDESSLQQLVPRFLLQPLFENACKHGFGTHGGTITVRSQIHADIVRIEVEDNGAGMKEQDLTKLRSLFQRSILYQDTLSPGITGVGLINVYKRMVTRHGNSFSIEVYSSEGIGTTFVLTFPNEGGVRDEGDTR